jgi:hypothetical protein
MKSFSMDWPGYVASKKSGQVIRRGPGRMCPVCKNLTGRPFVAQNKKTEECQRVLADRMGIEKNLLGALGGPIYPSESLALDIVFTMDADGNEENHIELTPIAEKPKGRNGRRQDTINKAELIQDALTKANVIGDDRQIADLHVRRVVEGELV